MSDENKVGEEITALANKFMEGYVWPRYGALGGPGIQECEEIVRAVLGCLDEGSIQAAVMQVNELAVRIEAKDRAINDRDQLLAAADAELERLHVRIGELEMLSAPLATARTLAPDGSSPGEDADT